ncbi:MAG: PQQ-dependent sugar dehydrogenase, partial [Actinomycetota bacterium]
MRFFLVLAAAVSLCLGACTDDDGLPQGGPLSPADPGVVSSSGGDRPDDFDARAVELSLEVVAEGLAEPLAIIDPGDGSDRLFVVEQDGLIKILRGGHVSEQPFLDLSAFTEGVGEQGLLGLAFHPDYSSNGRFFVDYTDLNGDTVVAEYRASEDPERADSSSARVLLEIDQPFSNHNGGHIVFGPDGYLYIGMGDGGSGGDPQGNGQSLDTLLGKLLRIDVDSRGAGAPYGIPADNPFVNRSGARPEIWAYGLRNPWRFSFDPAREELWIGDVGQENFEEIDRASDQAPGLNYGWNIMEGSACFSPPSDCDRSELVLPITEYTHE